MRNSAVSSGVTGTRTASRSQWPRELAFHGRGIISGSRLKVSLANAERTFLTSDIFGLSKVEAYLF